MVFATLKEKFLIANAKLNALLLVCKALTLAKR